MKKPNLDIVNLVGISLIVVAIVSAGGLVYTASTWANITETYATVQVAISDVTIFEDNSTGQVILTAYFFVDNPSNLDIEIYRIEYMTHADINPATITEFDRYVGSGTVGNRNNTVMAESMRQIALTMVINPDTPNMLRYEAAKQDGSVYIFLNGTVWYRIINYPEASQRMDGIFFLRSVVIYEG